MNWSLCLGTVAGARMMVHWTFLILLAWVFGQRIMAGDGVVAGMVSVAFIIAVFACVLLHELGHVVAARAYGIRTKSIVLFPIGGVAMLERSPTKPAQELVIAVAGPAVNVVIAAGILLGFIVAGAWPATSEAAMENLPVRLAIVNVMLVVFNMIPAFPMDGGRVLRALLAEALGRQRATRIAAGIGQVFAVAFAVAGLFWSPMLLLVAGVIFLGARAEFAGVRTEGRLRGLRAGDAMMTRFAAIDERATVGEALEVIRSGAQRDLPVVAGDVYRGLVSGRGLFNAGPGAEAEPAIAFADAAPGPVAEDAPLFDVVTEMNRAGAESVAVVREGRLVGLLTLEKIARTLADLRR